jgi:nucleotide-binding universal stress UspA family protein
MLPVPPGPEYSQANYKSDLNKAKQKLYQFCQDVTPDIDFEYALWGGALPHIEILKCAENEDADLIVMGSHTKEKQGKWYTGNAVEKVSFRSKFPVVAITDPDVLSPFGEGVEAYV